MRRQFGIKHDKIPALTISNGNRDIIPYPIDEPLFTDEIVAFATKVVKGEIEPERAELTEIQN